VFHRAVVPEDAGAFHFFGRHKVGAAWQICA
jgi:hypothetical protein